MTNVSNLVIEAVNSGKAQILYDDLVFFCSRNVTLSGVVVEQCGPVSPALYVYVSDGVTIQDCVFRCVLLPIWGYMNVYIHHQMYCI